MFLTDGVRESFPGLMEIFNRSSNLQDSMYAFEKDEVQQRRRALVFEVSKAADDTYKARFLSLCLKILRRDSQMIACRWTPDQDQGHNLMTTICF